MFVEAATLITMDLSKYNGGDFNEAQHQIVQQMIMSSMCTIHKKDLSIWCFDCNEKICADCVTKQDMLGHSNHIIMPLMDHIQTEITTEMTRKRGLIDMVKTFSQRYASYMNKIQQAYENVKRDLKCSNEYVELEYLPTYELRDILGILRLENDVLEKKCVAYPFQNLILEKIIQQTDVLNYEQLKYVVDDYICHNNVETSKLDIGFQTADIYRQSTIIVNFLQIQRYIYNKKQKELAECVALMNLNEAPADQCTPPKQQPISNGNYNPQSSPTHSGSFQHQQNGGGSPPQPQSVIIPRPQLNTTNNPRFFFDITLNNEPKGRIIIETFPQIAPKMSTNFEMLTIGEIPGLTYKNCMLSQLWQFESIITGSFRYNDKLEGRSIFVQDYFKPDESNLPARRGAVGMRRIKKAHENKGLVGSQFRVILNDFKQFTGIFGQVVYGLEYIDVISTYSNQQGQPTSRFIISNCGRCM